LRGRLAAQGRHCALFDSARYAREFGALIARMVERHDRGLAPDHLPANAGDSTASG
jgi:hypothetical protein